MVSTPPLLRLLRLVLAAWALCGCTTESEWSPPTGTITRRVVVLGIDGLDRQLLERMAKRGDLPNFQRIQSEGIIADMGVGQPILSPRIWTTIASGYREEVHGITDWVRRDGTPFRAGDV